MLSSLTPSHTDAHAHAHTRTHTTHALSGRPAAALLSNPITLFAFPWEGPDAQGKAVVAPLSGPLPDAVHLVALQLLPPGLNLTQFYSPIQATGHTLGPAPAPSTGSLLLRLRHVYQAGLDDPALAVPVSVDLAALLAPTWTLTAIEEVRWCTQPVPFVCVCVCVCVCVRVRVRGLFGRGEGVLLGLVHTVR